MTAINLNGLATLLSAASGIQYLLSPPKEASLTTLLFHRFIFAGESKDKARERLKRQLEWLRREYTPLSLTSATNALAMDILPKSPLLITIDDACSDLLEFYETFKLFEIPVAIFVCAGWTSQASDIEPESLLCRVVTALEWYQGPNIVFAPGNGPPLRISRAERTETIDQLLRSRDDYPSFLEELAARLDYLNAKDGIQICTWRELADLQRGGAQFGCHSVSHIRLATASHLRMAFEIHESKRITERKLGETSVFAYPYGIDGTFNKEAAAELKRANFNFAFLAQPDFATAKSDPLYLPRIALPDRDMLPSEFRARVKGGGIALRRVKRLLNKARK